MGVNFCLNFSLLSILVIIFIAIMSISNHLYAYNSYLEIEKHHIVIKCMYSINVSCYWMSANISCYEPTFVYTSVFWHFYLSAPKKTQAQ